MWLEDISKSVATCKGSGGEPCGLSSIGLRFVAAFMHRRFPSSRAAGRWIWVLPVVVLVGGLISELGMYPWEYVIGRFFGARGGDDGLTFVLITLPTISLCVYSLAVGVMGPVSD